MPSSPSMRTLATGPPAIASMPRIRLARAETGMMMSSARTRALPTARRPSTVVVPKVEAARAQVVGDAGRRERAVEDQRQLHVATAQIGRDRAGLEQPRRHAQILEAVLAEVDQTLGRDRERAAGKPKPKVGAAILERGDEIDQGGRADQPLDRTLNQQAGPDRALDGEGAVTAIDGEIGEGLTAEHGARPAAPVGPVAPALEQGDDGPVDAEQTGDEAIAGRPHRQAEVEPIGGRHRVEPQPQPVAAGEAGRGRARPDRARSRRGRRRS